VTGDLLTAAAFHEASHALVRRHFGCRIAGITVNADGCGSTRVLVPRNASDHPWRVALCALAGPLGEWIFTCKASMQGQLTDMRTVARALKEGGLDFDRVFDATATLIEHYRMPIAACAKALIRHGALDERMLSKVIRIAPRASCRPAQQSVSRQSAARARAIPEHHRSDCLEGQVSK
jgi:hypothetical protein